MKILPINPLPPMKFAGFTPIKPLPSIKDCFNKNKNKKIMEKERKITAPEGCEIEKVELIDGVAVVTFKEKERKLPKSWEEFCRMNRNTKVGESGIMTDSSIRTPGFTFQRNVNTDKNLLPDLVTAEAVLALCQLIQLRNAYNGDWIPDWDDENQEKYTIEFMRATTIVDRHAIYSTSPLYFKSKELCDEFLRNFRPLIEKLKPLYGIMEGGEE